MIMNVHGNSVDTLGEAAAVMCETVKPLVVQDLIDADPKAGMHVLSVDRTNEPSIAETKNVHPACPAPVKAF